MTSAVSLKSFLLKRALPSQLAVVILLTLLMALVFFLYSKPQIDARHVTNVEQFQRAIHNGTSNVLGQLKNIANNDFVVNSLVDARQQQYYLPMFIQSLQFNNVSDASIGLYSFDGQLLSSKNIQPNLPVIETFEWQATVLASGADYIEYTTDGVLIATPVFFNEGFVEGALLFYAPALSDLLPLEPNDLFLVMLDETDSVVFASQNAPFNIRDVVSPEQFSHYVQHSDETRQFTVISFESYAHAFSAVLYLLPFALITLFIAFVAIYVSNGITAARGVDTLRELRDYIRAGFKDTEEHQWSTNGVDSIQEMREITDTVEALENQVDALSLFNDRVNSVFNAVYEFLMVVDKDNHTILSNNACRQFMLTSKISGEAIVALITDDANAQVSGERLERRYEIPSSEQCITVSWYVTPLIDAEGKFRGNVIVGEDVSKQKQLQEELQLKTQAVDRASTSILISDITAPDEPIIYVNNACEALTGYSTSDFIGNNCRFLQGPKTSKADTQKIRDAINARQPVDLTLLNYRKDGSPFFNHLTLTPIKNDDGSVTHYLGIQRDVTTERQAAEYLEQAKARAEESSQMKTDFLANMSHEIRTPINGIYGVLQLLGDTSLDEKQSEFVRLASTSTHNLLHIINDILDLSKIEAGKLVIEKVVFDPLMFIHELVETYQYLAEEKGLQFVTKLDIPENVMVKTDPTRIRQIMVNLLSNALKFTEQGSIRMTFQIRSLDERCMLNMSVKDTGIGISSEKQQEIFEQFSQEDISTTRQFGGTGLGLTISQQLCKLLGGDIVVISQKGKGSQFSISLPIETLDRNEAKQDLLDPVSTDTAVHVYRNLGVLLVEDNDINQAVAANHLVAHDVTIAENGKQALDILYQRSDEFDVILMDCQMPVMDGFEASRQIRAGVAGETASRLPIIALTANAMKGDKERCIEAGMNDYLSKPFEASELNKKVRYWASEH